MALTSENSKRNIVFFGETGTGKSSAINLLLETGSPARISNDSQPCTQFSASYETTLNGTKYTLWDTRGLGEGSSFFRNIFGLGARSEKELKKFLKEGCHGRGIDLLVYCVRGSRATEASVKYYNNICAFVRRLVSPVVVLVTHLEREGDMDGWWDRNSSGLEKLKMEFDDHACITTLPDHPRTAESKEKLIDLIAKKRCWRAKPSGSFSGSSIQSPITSGLPRKGGVLSVLKGKNKATISNDRGLYHRPTYYTAVPRPVPMTRDSSYYTAHSPGGSVPASPIVEPPTPCSAAAHSTTLSRINTNLLGAENPSQSSGEETSSVGASLYSMYPSSGSSKTSDSEVHLQACPEESEDYLMSELPFRYSTATVVRRKSYASRQGFFGDVWECDLISEGSSRMVVKPVPGYLIATDRDEQVAVKTVKTGTDGFENLRTHEKKLRRELRVWGSLQHQNIVPLLGIVGDFGPLPSMVSPWFRNGSLSLYLAHHQTSKMEKHWLLGDIGAGLCYLHNKNVIHGDLHSDNVLINDSGRACLTDFGLSLVSDFMGTSYLNSSICGGVQFADPALVRQVDKSQDPVYPTKPCDVYSFGGLALHVLSGKKPYDGLSLSAIFMKVLAGERPKIPIHDKHITLWHRTLIQKCWDHEESKRPPAEGLVRMFIPASKNSQ